MEPLRLRVMNTRTHSVEAFVPKTPGEVRMYVCGPSVYDDAHLGHARSYVAYDAIKRFFLARGLKVTHAQNFTDVEESIAARAATAGKPPLEFAAAMIERFLDDMAALRVLPADHYPRVSEYAPQIVRAVEALEASGHAYRVDCAPGRPGSDGICDVYFDIERAKEFGLLIGETPENLAVERPLVSGDRRHALDFALWKSRDDWGVTWPSPWGDGRPGWHVECAVMALACLGPDFDFHGGGLDLVFPHHESERVIGEAMTHERYCNHYVHNGFVTVGARKMSKSLGNFVTVRDLLARHDAEVLRAFLLSAHYRASLDYDERAIHAAATRVAAWRAAIRELRGAAKDASAEADPGAVRAIGAAFWSALEDDFQFGRALDALDEVVVDSRDAKGAQAAATLVFLREAGAALGLMWSLDEKA